MMHIDVDPNEEFDDAEKPEEAAQAEAPQVEPKPTQTVVQLPQQEKKAIQVKADPRGLLRGTTIDEQFRLATAYCQSGLMPRGMDTPAKVLVGLQLCSELGLPVITSIGKVMVMNGTAAIHSDLPLALVRRSGLLKSIKEEWIYVDGKLDGAKCTVWRKGSAEPITRTFTVADAKTAQLWEKKSRDGKPSPWVLYPPRMLQYRARSWALKDEFGDVLFGVAILEYDYNAIVVDGQVVGQETETAADRLNRRYLGDETEKDSGQEADAAGQGPAVPGVRPEVGRGPREEQGLGGKRQPGEPTAPVQDAPQPAAQHGVGSVLPDVPVGGVQAAGARVGDQKPVRAGKTHKEPVNV